MGGAALQPEAVLPWLRGAVAAKRPLTVTVRSQRSGDHLTYRLRPFERGAQDRGVGQLMLVDLLTGPNNTSDYGFLGAVYFSPRGTMEALTGARTQRPDGSHGSSITDDAVSAQTLRWLVRRLDAGLTPAPHAEVWHDGSCSVCGRPLTTPESVGLGIGPVCLERVGGG